MTCSLPTRLMCFATTCAIALCLSPDVQAGNGWGWQKPINQKLGAFYTSNLAFKRKKSNSRSYRRTTSTPTYTVTPVYSQPLPPATTIQHMTVPSSRITTTTITSEPTRVVPQNSAAPVVATPPVSNTTPAIRSTAATNPAPVTTLSAAEKALQLLTLEPVTSTSTNVAPTQPSTVTKGAVRVVSP